MDFHPLQNQWKSTVQKKNQSQIYSNSYPKKKTSKMLSHPHLCRKSVSTTGHITSHFISRLSWFYIIARWTRGLFGWLVYSRQPTPNGFLQYKPWKSNTKQRMALILQVNNLKQPTAGPLFSLSHRTHVVESGQPNLRETPPPAAVSPRRQEKAAHSLSEAVHVTNTTLYGYARQQSLDECKDFEFELLKCNVC